MKKILTVFICLCLNTITFAQTKKTEIYVIGVVHDKSKILDPDKLFEILNTIKPDILLQENDSQQIKEYFDEIRPNSNEQTATILYLKKYPNTLNLPFEFEGRNDYRKKNGMVPTDNLTIKALDSLYQNNKLNAQESAIYKKYADANIQLRAYTTREFKDMNSKVFDSINKNRQYIQHKELPKITANNDYFKNKFVVKPNGEKISLSEGYQLWCNFWDLRNNSMAINIIKQANNYPGKRIVVLTGVQHRYYLKELLAKYYDGSYTVLDFF
ncbi:hypothetical protein [Flavobacterium sp. N1736]|uniref:hypothetical protein n=1 Tax=Flavobacterium sp. N1736 TaxID=2986823 RepID=UPI0022249024|nr:hypothetical protein [Flavobacterium sp. N1736]